MVTAKNRNPSQGDLALHSDGFPIIKLTLSGTNQAGDVAVDLSRETLDAQGLLKGSSAKVTP
jgi:hypothetical protein